jgi:hypothetical protein
MNGSRRRTTGTAGGKTFAETVTDAGDNHEEGYMDRAKDVGRKSH